MASSTGNEAGQTPFWIQSQNVPCRCRRYKTTDMAPVESTWIIFSKKNKSVSSMSNEQSSVRLIRSGLRRLPVRHRWISIKSKTKTFDWTQNWRNIWHFASRSLALSVANKAGWACRSLAVVNGIQVGHQIVVLRLKTIRQGRHQPLQVADMFAGAILPISIWVVPQSSILTTSVGCPVEVEAGAPPVGRVCTFWSSNVRFATAARDFSTSELQKVLRDRQFF